ncbi:MAG: SDR family NAD(P)-dependent oxidoreductase [Cellvibrionaceae bacterium]|nr:SDR family NAD(P)-dependent oxidoreductase [Cellvibrionaceae bacterium]
MKRSRIAVIGASGALGSALVNVLGQAEHGNTLYAFSRSPAPFPAENILSGTIDYEDEMSIAKAAQQASEDGKLDMVLVTTGILHSATLWPEKALRDLSADNFQKNFLVNTVGPALVAKHFLPLLQRDKRSIFAALSARVGSISDNRLGGWYAYRASKAALNMLIKTTSIELARTRKQAILVGLHPGTVASQLSEPFQPRVPKHKLFTADFSAQQLLSVLNKLTPADSGKVFAWDGSEVPS